METGDGRLQRLHGHPLGGIGDHLHIAVGIRVDQRRKLGLDLIDIVLLGNDRQLAVRRIEGQLGARRERLKGRGKRAVELLAELIDLQNRVVGRRVLGDQAKRFGDFLLNQGRRDDHQLFIIL